MNLFCHILILFIIYNFENLLILYERQNELLFSINEFLCFEFFLRKSGSDASSALICNLQLMFFDLLYLMFSNMWCHNPSSQMLSLPTQTFVYFRHNSSLMWVMLPIFNELCMVLKYKVNHNQVYKRSWWILVVED